MVDENDCGSVRKELNREKKNAGNFLNTDRRAEVKIREEGGWNNKQNEYLRKKIQWKSC